MTDLAQSLSVAIDPDKLPGIVSQTEVDENAVVRDARKDAVLPKYERLLAYGVVTGCCCGGEQLPARIEVEAVKNPPAGGIVVVASPGGKLYEVSGVKIGKEQLSPAVQ